MPCRDSSTALLRPCLRHSFYPSLALSWAESPALETPYLRQMRLTEGRLVSKIAKSVSALPRGLTDLFGGFTEVDRLSPECRSRHANQDYGSHAEIGYPQPGRER